MLVNEENITSNREAEDWHSVRQEQAFQRLKTGIFATECIICIFPNTFLYHTPHQYHLDRAESHNNDNIPIPYKEEW